MIFDVYFPFKNKAGITCPGVTPHPKIWDEVISICSTSEQAQLITAVRTSEGDARAEAKKQMPAICFTGKCTGKRAAKNMSPTGFYMIDIDHCEEPEKAWHTMLAEDEDWIYKYVYCVHITVSGKGLRVVCLGEEGATTLDANMEAFNQRFNLERFGKFDEPCRDYSRLSFLPYIEDFLFINPSVNADARWKNDSLINSMESPDEKKGSDSSEQENIAEFTPEEIAEFEAYEYRGNLLKTIIEKWVEVQGSPGKGEIHNYYNDMVKNFRNICSNNKRALLYLLPRFGHEADECWSSIKSICRVSTLSKLPRNFYFFLKDNGFYETSINLKSNIAEYMMSDEEFTEDADLPWMPPVFREFVRIAPKDFRVSVVNALLPVMGTLTSYLQAPYYFDGRMHTTSFFSIIYAPAGTGKGFVERIVNILFEQLKIRDYIQQARENIFLSTLNRKGANEKAPEDPHTSLRIIPPKNSEAEFLQKMKDNNGYHMFTYAAEMDSWAKGVRAAGGNKDDMIRIAWDNGEYGQQFKSASTFKGTVSLYWNLLITGTIQQLMAYFKNVENGLITRCSFTTIENQEFASAPIWKELNKQDMGVIHRFLQRCDNNTYEDSCNLLPDDVDSVSPDKFDEEIKWRFAFRQRKTVDMLWLMPTITEFLEAHRKKAAIDFDKARDVFRRRVAVRGFRLGLICCALWEKPRQSDLKKCLPFIKWWMEQDIESSLKLWGTRYNNEVEEGPHLVQRSLYNELPSSFSKPDVYTLCVKMNIKTQVRVIIHRWKQLGYVEKVGNNQYQKTNPKKS